MKTRIFLLAGFLLPILGYCQNPDTIKRNRLTTTAPLLGGITITDAVAPIKINGSTIIMQQPVIDLGIPVYKDFSKVNAVLIKTGVRYQGLFLSNEEHIGENAFHSFTVPLLINYSLSRSTSISFIGLATLSSDLTGSVSSKDIQYTLGARIGFRPSNTFKYGITLTYLSNFSGNFILPLPDIDWTISPNWSLIAILPARASLKYKLFNSQSLGATFSLSGGMYRLHTGNQPQYLHLQQNSAGLIYDLKLGKRFTWTMIAGHTITQRLETFNNDQRVPFEGFGKLNDRVPNVSYRQNSFIFQGGLSYSF